MYLVSMTDEKEQKYFEKKDLSALKVQYNNQYIQIDNTDNFTTCAAVVILQWMLETVPNYVAGKIQGVP